MRLRKALAVALIGLLIHEVRAEELLQTLHARIPSHERERGCSIDPLNLAARADVKKVIRFLAIDEVQINFVGCLGGGFKTVMGLRDQPSNVTYAVYYPVASHDENQWEQLLAPIVHELAHVMQSRKFGDVATLMDKNCIEKIELSADFITGFVFNNVIKVKDKSLFQTSLSLLGSFTKDAPDNHGTPAYRASAFRTGYFISAHRKIAELSQAELFFDRVYFLEIVSGEQEIVKKCRQKQSPP